MMRSILAVLTALVVVPCLAGLGDRVVQIAKPHAFDSGVFGTDPGLLWLTLVYVTLFAGVAGWLAALISRRADLRDVWILAGIQFVLTIVATVFNKQSPGLWYCAMCAIFPPAAIVAGGWTRVHRTHRTGPPTGVTA